MKRLLALLAVLALGVLCSTAYALYTVSDVGEWPKTWPNELEGLRKQARTLIGPLVEARHYAIRFTKQDEFEAAWPKLLQVKTKGAPVVLVRGPNFFLGDEVQAGVVVHSAPLGQHTNPATPEAPIAGVEELRMRWMNTTYIELVVDGDVIDLNRIPLPQDGQIVDQRFDKPVGK